MRTTAAMIAAAAAATDAYVIPAGNPTVSVISEVIVVVIGGAVDITVFVVV